MLARVINHPAFMVDPWCLREKELDLDVLAQSESLFALSNGNIGWRGNLDEGEPEALPGCYLNGLYERRPLPYAESAFGFPESGQTMVNATDGKLIRLLVDDEPFDVRYGQVVGHQRCLDFRAGVLRRDAEWTSPAGRRIRMSATRLVSFSQRSVAAICYEVEVLDGSAHIVLQSELVANEKLPPAGGDPRVAAMLDDVFAAVANTSDGVAAALVHRTRRSGLTLAATMDHIWSGPDPLIGSESSPDRGRITFSLTLVPGQRFRLLKFVAYGWSSVRSAPAVLDQCQAAVLVAKQTGWEDLLTQQRNYLDAFWDGADVELDGDPEIQQAARFGLFHVLQAGARAEGRSIPAKGLTGSGYDGHCFWDTETFVLPVLTYTAPDTVAHALRWRHSTLPLALQRALELGHAGAAFPWRTIDGQECSGYWPAGTAAFHVSADIAAAVIRYVDATGDEVFEADVGLDLLVQTARLWLSLGHYDGRNRFCVDGVTGPDEYSALADNNLYTNLMAQQNLAGAAAAVGRHPGPADLLGVDQAETDSWRRAAGAVLVPYDDALGVHSQDADFTGHEIWDFAATSAQQYPLMMHFPYFDLYRKQVVKQADVVLAMQMCPDLFSPAQTARNFAYYERLTVRDSSLSACTQAVIAAEVGHLNLAHDYLGETALIDLGDLAHNTRDGLHIASLAGVWTVLVAGYGGMRQRGRTLRFAPRLPDRLTRLVFTMRFAGRRLRVEITPTTACYRLLSGEPMTVTHHDRPVETRVGLDSTVSIPTAPVSSPPTQPLGRAPVPRMPGQ